MSAGTIDGWARAGVVIRESAVPNARHAFMAITPGHGAAFQRRATTGGSTRTWRRVGSATIPMATDVRIGLAVTSHRDGTPCTATFDQVVITAAPAAVT